MWDFEELCTENIGNIDKTIIASLPICLLASKRDFRLSLTTAFTGCLQKKKKKKKTLKPEMAY